MKTNNHTPGPWRPHIDRDHYDSRMHNIRVHAVELEEHPQGPLTVAILNQNLDDEAIANARLISAAPCMLFALTIARAHMRQTIDQAPSTGDILAGALAVVDEAIETATGGTFE